MNKWKESAIYNHFIELGREAMYRGTNKFVVDLCVYANLCREGFTLRDELEAFCWSSGATVIPNQTPLNFIITVPSRDFWEFWLEQLSDQVTQVHY